MHIIRRAFCAASALLIIGLGSAAGAAADETKSLAARPPLPKWRGGFERDTAYLDSVLPPMKPLDLDALPGVLTRDRMLGQLQKAGVPVYSVPGGHAEMIGGVYVHFFAEGGAKHVGWLSAFDPKTGVMLSSVRLPGRLVSPCGTWWAMRDPK